MIEIPLSKQRKRVSYQTLSTNRTLSTYFLNIREAIVCQVLHAQNDADHLIVDTAVVAAAESGSPIVIIGEDTDLLVLLCSNDTASVKNMYFMSDSKSGTKNTGSTVHQHVEIIVCYVAATETHRSTTLTSK